MMTIDNKFNFGDLVSNKVDIEKEPYIVTQIDVRANNLSYGCQREGQTTWFNDFELELIESYEVKKD